MYANIAKQMQDVADTFFGFRNYVYNSIQAAAYKGESGTMIFVKDKFYEDYRFQMLIDELCNHDFTVCEEENMSGVTVHCIYIYWDV